jgi:TIR domain-containing protein
MSIAAPFEVEEFWDDLLAFIEDRSVVPVVGAELLTIEESGRSVPLYRAVAERLLSKYGLSGTALPGGAVLREHHELNDAVCALGAVRRIRDLYRPVHDILQKLLAEQKEPLQPLRELASIRHFDLFTTTTSDDLLARALNAVRFNGSNQTDQIEYAPKLPTERRRDIPEVPSSKYTAVFYLFGKADVSPFFAIHDEDALEFPYALQAGSGPERMFSQLRSRNLLLIGCTFADWLSPFFLRLCNSERLFSDQRAKKEFLVGEETARDPNVTVFLERFSQDSKCYAVEARAFVGELYQRWSERNPTAGTTEQATVVREGEPAVASTGGTIFISYSSDDVGAAKKLFADLEEIGGDVAWFDKSALKPGDPWDQHIRSAVQRCSLFLPLLSANTERRTEGYFRLEWNEAAERSKRIQGRKFIFPVVIDPDYTGAMGRYALVPEQFTAFQYSHAPAGQMSDELKGELREQLRTLRRARGA